MGVSVIRQWTGVFLKCQRLQRGFSHRLQVRHEERRLCLLRQRHLRWRQSARMAWVARIEVDEADAL